MLSEESYSDILVRNLPSALQAKVEKFESQHRGNIHYLPINAYM